MAIADAGTEAQKQELLPRLAQGQIIVTMALTEPNARLDAAGIETRATQSEDSFVINGTKLFLGSSGTGAPYELRPENTRNVR